MSPKRRRTLLAYWLLLVVPTLVIGGWALRLLGHEQARLRQLADSALTERAGMVAADIALAVADVKRSLMDTLRGFPDGDLARALKQWRQHDPFVRNVFMWRRGEALILPNPSQPATTEEERFVRRYDRVFNGRVPLAAAPADAPAPAATYTSSAQLSVRTGLRRGSKQVWQQAPEQPAAATAPEHGWLTWFSENSLFLLGWFEPNGGAPIRGVEIETMMLLSRLTPALPTDVPADMAFALVDGSGNVLHQTGALPIDDTTPRVAYVLVGAALPHWHVAVYSARRESGRGRAFILLSGMLVAVFVLTILVAGWLLIREAHRSIVEATQKTSFVSNVSHELKTPLTSIRMYAELLGEGRVADDRKRDRYLQTIVSESRRLTRLINNVLDFSRLEEGRKRYHLESVEVTAVIAGLLEMQSVRIREAALELSSSVPEDAGTVHTDRDVLEQALLNLIDNAIKYAAEGGVLELTVEPGRSKARITVQDRGPGVPRADRERIFEKFHRVDDSLTTSKPGCGLGLAIARRMLRDVGGDLFCEARRGGGARFVIVLPGSGDKSDPGSGAGL